MHDKGKDVVAPSSPSSDSTKSVSSCMHLRDNCSHSISDIKPKGSTQPEANSEKSKGYSSKKGTIASQSGKCSFLFYFIIVLLRTMDCWRFWTTNCFWIFGYYMFGYDLKYHWYLIFKLWKWLWEPQGGMCLIDFLIMFIFVKKLKGVTRGPTY